MEEMKIKKKNYERRVIIRESKEVKQKSQIEYKGERK